MTMELDAYKAGVGGHLRLGIIPFVPGLLVGKMIAGLTGEKHKMSVSAHRRIHHARLLEDPEACRSSTAVIGRLLDGYANPRRP
jgi:hypothetical protein